MPDGPRSRPKAVGPDWWPATSEITLLDVRDGFCQISLLNCGEATMRSWCEPAWLRRGPDGTPSHWGRRALAWHGRLPEGQVCPVFPTGWPLDPGLARWYLRKLHETYLTKKRGCRILLVEPEPRPWARQLWQESLEDTPFSVQGYLDPWQHDVLLAKFSKPEQALSPFLCFRLDETMASWQLLQYGAVAASGSHPGLSSSRLLGQMGDYLRRHRSLEAGCNALKALVLASFREGQGRPDDLRLPVAGRQIWSGLPSRQIFDWPEFLAGRPGLVEAWREVKRRIYQQAEELSGVAPGRDEGLDLPGWRILSSGQLAPLFVEGPVVRLFDGL